MELYKRLSITILGVLSLFILERASAAMNKEVHLCLEESNKINYLQRDVYDYAGIFSGIGAFELPGIGAADQLITDTEVSSLVGMPDSSVFAADIFTSQCLGISDEALGVGQVYGIPVNTVPLPEAVWLFATALLGFAAYSARLNL